MLELKGIYKSFGDTEVLKGVDVSVEEGDIVGIIGSSGSGKSTLLRCINFLEHADAGQMELDGVSFDVKNPGKQNILYMRRNTAMVFQQFNLFKEKNARENVMMGLTHVQNKSKEEAEKIADDLLDKVGLSERKEFFPSQLSGGQQQRVALARALVNRPNILLADEPTGNLDPKNSLEIMKLLEEINERGTTVLVVTHNREIVNSFRKRVITMRKGVIVSDEEEGGYLED